MQVLLVNDDGAYADGLHALRRRLEAAGIEVCVAAPERERSAMGHAITLHKPLQAPVKAPVGGPVKAPGRRPKAASAGKVVAFPSHEPVLAAG